MTPTEIRELAERLYLELYCTKLRPRSETKEIIYTSLLRVQEKADQAGFERCRKDFGAIHAAKWSTEDFTKGWNSAIEKAAEISDDHNGCIERECLAIGLNCGVTISKEIRALKL